VVSNGIRFLFTDVYEFVLYCSRIGTRPIS
jgi:hypothetical protein